MKKRTKKNIQLGVILLAVFSLATFTFIFFTPQTIFTSPVNYGTTASLIQETDEYAIYRINVDLVSNEGGYVEQSSFLGEYGANINLVEGLIKNEFFDAQSFKIGGLTGYCDYQGGNQQVDTSAYFEEKNAECKIVGNQLIVKFSGKIGTQCTKNTGYKIKGDLTADCKIYKQGHEPRYTYYRLSNNKCSQIQLLEQEKTSNDYNTLNECESQIEQTTPPPPPEPSGWNSILQKIVQWLNNLWDSLFKQSITGDTQVQPGSSHTYQIDLTAPSPDKDFSDGSYSTQFSNWALLDSDGNILKEGNWEEVNGKYTKSVTLTVPTESNKQYALIGVITQTDGTYNYPTGKWTYGEEYILNKEAIDIKTLYEIEEPGTLTPSGFSKFISSIVDWFKNLFSGWFK